MDNVVTDPGAGGATIAADEIAGVHYPRSKIVLGDDNTNDGDVSAANPMPVKGSGTAGTANAGVVTVQGIASMVPVQVADNGSSLTVDNAGTFAVQATQAGSWSVTVGAALPAGDNNIGNVDIVTVPAPLNVVGGGVEAAALRVTIASDSTGVLSIDDNGGSLTVDGTVAASQSGAWSVTVGAALPAGTNNIGDVDVLTVPAPLNLTGGGLEATALRVTIASDSTGVLSVDDNGGSLTVDGTVAATQAGAWTVQPGNTANTTPWLVADTARTAGGTSLPYAFLSTAAVQTAAIKASAGQVYALHFFNIGAAAVYVRLYNMTTAPGTTDTPVYRAIIPGNAAGAGFVVPIPPGVEFSTGVGIRVTGAIADNDATALAANQVIGNVFYR